MQETQLRGQLTDRIKKESENRLGYVISQQELRLMNFVYYTLTNDQKISRTLVNDTEMDILAEWVELGYITDGISPNGRPMISAGAKLKVTKSFWNAMSDLLWLGYVDLHP